MVVRRGRERLKVRQEARGAGVKALESQGQGWRFRPDAIVAVLRVDEQRVGKYRVPVEPEGALGKLEILSVIYISNTPIRLMWSA